MLERLKRYIRLESSIEYNIILLCRYKKEDFRYRFLRFSDDTLSSKAFKVISIAVLELTINFINYKIIYYSVAILLGICIAFLHHFLGIIGAISIFLMLIYILVVLVQEEVKKHEILYFVFESLDNKTAGERCFKSIECYGSLEKMHFILMTLKGQGFVKAQNPKFYMGVMKSIIEYTESDMPNYIVEKAYSVLGDEVVIIE